MKKKLSKNNIIDDSECPVCFDKLDFKKDQLKCGHYVHLHCIEFSMKPECPICEYPIRVKKVVLNQMRDRRVKFLHYDNYINYEYNRNQYIDKIFLLVLILFLVQELLISTIFVISLVIIWYYEYKNCNVDKFYNYIIIGLICYRTLIFQ